MYCAEPFRRSGTLTGLKPQMVENVQTLVNLLDTPSSAPHKAKRKIKYCEILNLLVITNKKKIRMEKNYLIYQIQQTVKWNF
jgi:hypothetical protein